MGFRFSKHALGGIVLLAVGCSGHDIRLTTGNGGSGGGNDLLSAGRDSGLGGGTSGGGDNQGGSGAGGSAGGDKGGPYFAGNGGGDDAFGGSGGDNDVVVDNAAGAGGAPDPGPEHGGWLAYDLDLSTAFGTGRQIQILRADGSCEREFIWATDTKKNVKQPAFSADGKQIAYASDSTGTFQIYVMDLVSHESTQITSDAQGATFPSWSPNGKSIAYVTGDPEDKYDPYVSLDGSNTSGSTVMLVDVTTLQTTALTALGRPPYTSSSFASDNRLFVGNSISVIGIHTDTLTRDGVSPTDAFFTMKSSPSISPDGSRFVFMAHCSTQTQLFTERVEGTTPPLCNTATPLAKNSDGLITANWGPSGYIAAETSHHDIVLVPSDGSLGIKVLVNSTQPERNPTFAPASVALDCKE